MDGEELFSEVVKNPSFKPFFYVPTVPAAENEEQEDNGSQKQDGGD